MHIHRTRRAGTALCLVLVLAGAASAFCEDPPKPFADARDRETQYVGPGRELPPPAGLREVRIAYFGPADERHPLWGDAWRGALLAVEETNASGGYRSIPFRLESAWSDSPWGSGVADLAKLVYDDGVWAIVGGVDGTTTHLAEQIVTKSNLALVSPGGTDPSVNFTNVPWMFTLLPTDDRLAETLVDALAGAAGSGSWALVAAADHDARTAVQAVRSALTARHGAAPALERLVPPSAPDYRGAAADIAGAGVRAVLVLAGSRDAAHVVRDLRAAGFRGAIVGGAPAGRRLFAEEAGPAAEGVVYPLLFDPASDEARAFTSVYESRWGATPDYLAASAHDAVRLVVDAIRRAGPNRALIRDALAALSPWRGVAGTVTWDRTGRNEGPPTALGVWSGGRAHPVEARSARAARGAGDGGHAP